MSGAQERYRAEVALCMNDPAVTLQDRQRRPELGSAVKVRLGWGALCKVMLIARLGGFQHAHFDA